MPQPIKAVSELISSAQRLWFRGGMNREGTGDQRWPKLLQKKRADGAIRERSAAARRRRLDLMADRRFPPLGRPNRRKPASSSRIRTIRPWRTFISRMSPGGAQIGSGRRRRTPVKLTLRDISAICKIEWRFYALRSRPTSPSCRSWLEIAVAHGRNSGRTVCESMTARQHFP